jgi:hypothetical protein
MVIVLVGEMEIYVGVVEALKKEDRMNLSLPPKLVEKLIWVLFISLCNIFIPNYMIDALLC